MESERNQVALEMIEIALGSHAERRAGKVGLLARLTRAAQTPDPHTAADRALSELACRWSLLSEPLRHATVPLAGGRWARALEGVTSQSSDLARRSAVQLAEDGPEPGLAAVCVRLLSDPEVPIAAAAGRALVTIVQAAGSQSASLEPDVLRAMLDIGVHRCRGAAVAAMVLLTPPALRGSGGAPGPLASWFLGEDGEPHSALRKALRSDRSAVSRERAWEWLKLPRLAAASGERLRAVHDLTDFESLLQRWHLLANPDRRREWGSLRGSGRAVALPGAHSLPQISAGARRGLIALREAQGDGADARSETVSAMLHEDAPSLRCAAARAAGPNELIDFCFDRDPRVARSALLAWSAAGELGHDGRLLARVGARTSPPRRRWLGKLARSPHPHLRSFASEEQRSTDWLDPSSSGGRATAWAMLKADRSSVLGQLRELIESGDDETRTRAILVVRRLNLTAECADALTAVVQGEPLSIPGGREALDATSPAPQPRPPTLGRARATAVIALGELRSARADEILRACVKDDEPRVRANAVEALGRRLWAGSPSGETLAALALNVMLELKQDNEHRARANALRALLIAARSGVTSSVGPGGVAGGLIELKPSAVGEPGTLGDVLAMLGDPRAMHRLAGTWLSARLVRARSSSGSGARLIDLTARLGELARGDADARVRDRAGRCISGLNEAFQSVRTDRAPGERAL